MTTANASAETKWREEQFFEEATKCGKENDVGAKQCLSRHPAWKGVIMWPQLRLDSWGRVAFDENVELHERRDQSLLTETGEKSLLNCVVAKNPSSSCRPTTPAARALPASSGARPAASTSSSSCPTPRDSSRLSTSTTRGSTRRTALRAPGEVAHLQSHLAYRRPNQHPRHHLAVQTDRRIDARQGRDRADTPGSG